MTRAALFVTISVLAWPVLAAEKTVKSVKPAPRAKRVAILADHVPAVRGPLSLDRAVALALKQNPDLLRALQEIERTRGQVIEVRAQALPHVVATGNFSQRENRLLEKAGTGGSGGGGGSAQPLVFKDQNGNTFTLENSGNSSSTNSFNSGFGSASGTGAGDKSWIVT